VEELETEVSGRVLSVVFNVTSSFVVSGCDTSWGEEFLPITKAGVRLRLFKSGLPDSDSSSTKLIPCPTESRRVFGHSYLMGRNRHSCVPEIASIRPLASP